MIDIDVRLLQAALAVAEELNLSRAAHRLGITQPALTKRIHELEHRLGVLLFERTNRGVVLTDHCRAFIEDARLAVLHLERAIQQARASGRGAEAVLHLGRSPYIDPYIVNVVSSNRLPLYPTLRIETSSNFSAELSRQVLARELDLALITEGTRSPLLNYLIVDTASFFVLFRDNEVLRYSEALGLTDLDERPWVLFGKHVHPVMHDKVLLVAKARNIRPADIRGVQTAEEAAQLVSQNGGVALLTPTGAWRAMEPGLTIRPLQEPELRLRTVLITRANDESRLISEFVRSSMRRFERLTQRQLSFQLVG